MDGQIDGYPPHFKSLHSDTWMVMSHMNVYSALALSHIVPLSLPGSPSAVGLQLLHLDHVKLTVKLDQLLPAMTSDIWAIDSHGNDSHSAWTQLNRKTIVVTVYCNRPSDGKPHFGVENTGILAMGIEFFIVQREFHNISGYKKISTTAHAPWKTGWLVLRRPVPFCTNSAKSLYICSRFALDIWAMDSLVHFPESKFKCCSSVCQKIIEKSFAWTVVPLFACHCDIQGTNWYQLVLPKLIQENERRLGKNAMCHHQPLKLPSRKCSVHINLRILRSGSDWIWNDCSLSANPTLSFWSKPTLTSSYQHNPKETWIPLGQTLVASLSTSLTSKLTAKSQVLVQTRGQRVAVHLECPRLESDLHCEENSQLLAVTSATANLVFVEWRKCLPFLRCTGCRSFHRFLKQGSRGGAGGALETGGTVSSFSKALCHPPRWVSGRNCRHPR